MSDRYALTELLWAERGANDGQWVGRTSDAIIAAGWTSPLVVARAYGQGWDDAMELVREAREAE